MVLTPDSTTQLLIPRTKTRKSTKAPREGPTTVNRSLFAALAPIYTPFTIAGERLDMSVPGLFVLAGREPRVQ